jgi:hypothetical protein
VLAAAIALKAAALVVERALGASTLLAGLDLLGTIGLAIGGIALALRGWARLRRVFLWRVRRRLILSYVFIGFVPALLIVSFFLIAGLLLFLTIAAYLVDSRVLAVVADARALAQTAAVEVGEAVDRDAVSALTARVATAADRHSGVSAVVLPAPPCGGPPRRSVVDGSPAFASFSVGPWAHGEAPGSLPAWLSCEGVARLTTVSRAGRVEPVARGVARVAGVVSRVVVVDIPLGDAFARALDAEAGIRPTGLVAATPARTARRRRSTWNPRRGLVKSCSVPRICGSTPLRTAPADSLGLRSSTRWTGRRARPATSR